MPISYYHPSVDALKAKASYVKISESGGTLYNKTLFMKERQAQHSAVSSKDTMINNVAKFFELTTSNYDLTSLPKIDQSINPCCQIIPYLHAIQTYLNFPLDYEKFISCIPAEPLPPGFLPDNWPISSPDKPFYKDYLRVAQLLFSRKCFPVHESLETPCDKTQNFSEIDDNSCDGCSKNIGIRVKAIFLDENNEKYKNISCDELYFPRPFVLRGMDVYRLRLLTDCQLLENDNYCSWEQVEGLNYLELEDIFNNYGRTLPTFDEVLDSAHAVTALDCSRNPDTNCYEITIKNSWGDVPNETFIYTNCSDNFWFNQISSSIFSTIHVAVRKFCNNDISRDVSEDTCLNEECVKIGYNYYNSESDSECKCENYATETTSTPLVQNYYVPPI